MQFTRENGDDLNSKGSSLFLSIGDNTADPTGVSKLLCNLNIVQGTGVNQLTTLKKRLGFPFIKIFS